MSASDRFYMELAFDQARLQAERYGYGENKVLPDPLVGCVIVTRDGRVATGFRAQNDPKDHAEVTVLKMLVGEDLKGATVFTTLEPCTNRVIEVACADRLIKAGVKRVFIGYMDPDE